MGKTFRDIYKEVKSGDQAAAAFIAEMARITKKSEATVRMYIAGRKPDALTMDVISKRLGESPEALFPENKQDFI